MLKKLLALFLLCITVCTYAQSDSTRNQFSRYDDNKSEIIAKGRRVLTEKLINNDQATVLEIKNQLLLEENNAYMALYPVERELLLYYTHEFDELKAYFLSTSQIDNESYNRKIKPSGNEIYNNLIYWANKNTSAYEKSISEQVKNAEDRDFLILYLHHLLQRGNQANYTQASLNTEATLFLNTYSSSIYSSYIRNYIRYEIKTSNWGYGFEVFSGYGAFNGNISRSFSNNVPFGVDFDLLYRNFSLNARAYVGIGHVKEDYLLINGTIWPRDKQANTYNAEASIGYKLPLKSRIRISPFAGVSSLGINPVDADKEEDFYKAANKINSFSWVGGLSVDIPISKKYSSVNMIGRTESSLWFIRLRYGYCMPSSFNNYPGLTGQFHYFSIGVGGFTWREKRKL